MSGSTSTPLTVSSIGAPLGTYGAGSILPITVNLSAAATVEGQPTLVTNAGTASYAQGGSSQTSLLFLLVVPVGAAAGTLSVAALVTGNASIANSNGSLQPQGAAGILSGVLLSGVAPVAVSTGASSASVAVGVPVDITVAMSESVAAAGTGVALTLSNGAVVPFTVSTGQLLHFTYTPQPGQLSLVVGIASIASATPVVDRYGNPADFTAAIGPIRGGLAVVIPPPPANPLQVTAQQFFGGLPARQPPRIPAEYIGVPQATLQQWLTEAQTTLQSVMLGQNVQSVGYSQGGGMNVSYSPADAGMLRQRILSLSAALGLTQRRHALRPGF